ncbi:MAG: Gfo/Idh/MocA family oxidoreductase [Kiritimatiellaeota bacterium]|nr:Gfo/Idh/MocA family oxidoreductase [Kiritimatiellota bacterium]
MSEKAKVKIGFVGVGGMGQAAHLRHYAQVPECEIVALAEVKADLAKKVAAKWGVPKVYASHTEMLANEKLDGIVASQPFTRHGTLIPELLKAGIPVLTEKPIAGSIEMGEKILAAEKAANTRMMIAYHKRSDPASMAAMNEIARLRATGELGKLTYIRIIMPAGDWVANGFCQNVYTGDPAPQLEWDPPASDMDKETNDAYITFVNYYIHQVNYMRYLLGETWMPKFAAKSGVQLSGESASGIACSLEMTPFQSTIDWQEQAFVCFEKGWVRITLPAPLTTNRAGKLEIYRDPGNGATPRIEEWQMPWVGAMWQQARNFVAAIQGDRDVACCSAADALEDLKFAREFIKIWKRK